MAVTPFELTEAFTMENFNLRIRQMNDSITEAGGFVAQSTAPTNTGKLWIDTGNANVMKFYDKATSTWKPITAAWG